MAGLINLRGQVVTAIELRERLGSPTSSKPATSRRRRTPWTGRPARELIRGGYKLAGQLLLVLDVQEAVAA